MARPVLSLDTLIVRSFVSIDGKPYEMRNAEELSILHFHSIGKHGKKVEALLSEAELSDEGVADLDVALRTLVRIILIAPDEILDALSDAQRVAITTTFTELQTKAPVQEKTEEAPVEAPVETEGASTGVNNSRD